MNTRRLVTLAIALLAASATWSAAAQGSSKPVTILVPFSAGGQLDVMARTVAKALGETLGTTVVVENLPGAGGLIAARKVLNAPADGLTVFQGTPSQLVLAGLVNKESAIKPSDFIPIHMIGTSPYAIFVRPGLKATNADELAVLAREAAKSGQPLTYASVGVGTLNHLLAEDMSRRINAPLTHIPYKGGAEVMRDLAGGRVDILLNIYTSQQIALADEGRIRFVAALSPKRQELLPNVPSVDEGSALKGFYAEIWTSLFVREGTPASTVAALNKAMASTLANEALQKDLLRLTGTKAATPLTSPAAVNDEYIKNLKPFQDLGASVNLAK